MQVIQEGHIFKKFFVKNIAIKPPVDDNTNDEQIICPEDFRNRCLTYARKIIADILQVQEIIDCELSGLELKDDEDGHSESISTSASFSLVTDKHNTNI